MDLEGNYPEIGGKNNPEIDRELNPCSQSETLLYQLVCQIFPNENIYRHYRPDFLEYLELDVFIPHLNIGMEYQGVQHFEPVEHWGGEESLKQVKARDKRKKTLCSRNDIKLIYFYYNEELSRGLIEDKIKKVNEQ